MESRSTVSAAVRTVLPSIEIHRAYISSPARSPNMPGTEPSSSTSTPRQRLQLARPPPGRRPRTPRCPAGSRQPPRTNARPNGAAGRHALRDRHRSALRRRRLHGGRRRRPHPHPRPALRSRPPGHFTRPSGSPRTPARPPRSSSTAPSSTTPTIAQSHRILAAADVAICPVTLHQRIAHSHAFNSGRCAAETEPGTKGRRRARPALRVARLRPGATAGRHQGDCMTDRNDLTDAIEKLNEDPEAEPATPPAKPTPMHSGPSSTPPAAAAPRRAARPDPQPAAPVTMNILMPRRLRRRLRHYAIRRRPPGPRHRDRRDRRVPGQPRG